MCVSFYLSLSFSFSHSLPPRILVGPPITFHCAVRPAAAGVGHALLTIIPWAMGGCTDGQLARRGSECVWRTPTGGALCSAAAADASHRLQRLLIRLDKRKNNEQHLNPELTWLRLTASTPGGTATSSLSLYYYKLVVGTPGWTWPGNGSILRMKLWTRKMVVHYFKLIEANSFRHQKRIFPPVGHK